MPQFGEPEDVSQWEADHWNTLTPSFPCFSYLRWVCCSKSVWAPFSICPFISHRHCPSSLFSLCPRPSPPPATRCHPPLHPSSLVTSPVPCSRSRETPFPKL